MSRRIDIELTSSRSDGSWTWRAAGAKVPKGVLDGSILPAGASVGDELKVEVEQEIDGITVVGVVPGREKSGRTDVIELIDEASFEPVTQQLAKRDRGKRREGDRGDRGERGKRREGGRRADGPGDERRGRPSFTPPPELPKRPKPKRLRPGSARRTEVLGELPEEQRPIAELALQGLSAVRQRLRVENEKLRAEGKAPMPESSVLKLAEELLPRLRLAEWLDRAEAAKRQLDHLDLRDLRSVVAAADDPTVARNESTQELAAELRVALQHRQEEELQLWFGDIGAALDVGRVVRALRLSSQPPKAGVPFPPELAKRLAEATNASLTPADLADRWSAVLEAAAFSPVRTMVAPTEPPTTVTDELRTTVTRLGPALPQVAALFGIEVPDGASMPKPLRPTARKAPAKGSGAKPDRRPGDRS
ncbi:MAG: hypothetical protein WD225_06615 [Ilumatobacteraceae bacterium]